jgi:tyrosinase
MKLVSDSDMYLHSQYWNWGRYAKDPVNSPLFNGDEYSMSGNGLKVQHPGIMIPGAPRPYDVIPPADGGGCVTTGPFKKSVVVSYLPPCQRSPSKPFSSHHTNTTSG